MRKNDINLCVFHIRQLIIKNVYGIINISCAVSVIFIVQLFLPLYLFPIHSCTVDYTYTQFFKVILNFKNA